MNKIIQGDCIEVMKTMEANSIDTILTDPPYLIGFMSKSWDKQDSSFHYLWAKEALRVAKPGASLLCFGGTRTYHRMACAIEDAGWIIKDCILWIYGSGFPKSHNISKALDKKAGKKGEEYLREDFVKRSNKTEQRPSQVISGQKGVYNKPATPEAKLWEGYGTSLKPSYEPIIWAVKKNEGTYAENALKHGVAGINIDGGRIKTEGKKGFWPQEKYGNKDKDAQVFKGRGINPENLKGRFPANIILDEEAAKEAGDWKRYFYCAKASKAERNIGCEELEEKRGGSMQANITDKMQLGGASLKGEHKEIQSTKNNHPTVKPIKLMEYLCLLTKTPTGGVILDPFMGSGSTALACQNVGRDFIGIEKEPEYVEIARARIKANSNQLRL